VAAELGPHLDQQGQSALNELAIVVERARYDREPEHDDRLRQRVEEVTGAIERRWASPTAGIWWPRSLWPRTLLR
jgi:hypothetical protein